MAEAIMIPEIWAIRGVKTLQQVYGAIDEAKASKELLEFDIYAGKSQFGNILLIIGNDGTLKDVYPIDIDKDTYERIKADVDESGLGEPDDLHLAIVSLAIAIDYMNYTDSFLAKERINGRYSLFESSVHDSGMGEMIIISVEGLGKLVVGYPFVKEILMKYA